jgi:hypothetical protein
MHPLFIHSQVSQNGSNIVTELQVIYLTLPYATGKALVQDEESQTNKRDGHAEGGPPQLQQCVLA